MVLEVKNISKRFGGVTALSQLSFNLKEGEVLGLIGPNGSGKTTVFNVVTGLYHPEEGGIYFQDKDITREKVYRIARMGIARTFQATRLFFNLTVWENIRTISETYISAREQRDHISEALSFAGLEEKANWIAHELPSAQQRLLMIAMSLCVSPRVLLLDEPTAGMNTEEVSDTMGLIRRIKQKGCAVLLIEHNMRAVTSICERCIVLNYGKLIADGSVQEVKTNPGVIQAYLGHKQV